MKEYLYFSELQLSSERTFQVAEPYHHTTCINYRFHETKYLPMDTVTKMSIWSPEVPHMWYNEMVLHEYTSRKHWADVSSSDQRPQPVMSRSLHLKRLTLRLRVSRGSTLCWFSKNYGGNVSWAMDSLTIFEAMRSNRGNVRLNSDLGRS